MRRFVVLLGVLIMAMLAILPASAQMSPNTVTFNGFSFSYDSSLTTNVNIVQFPGDALDAAYPGGPQPPYTQFTLYNSFPPAPENIYGASTVGITVYRIADTAGYSFYVEQISALQNLLAARPDLAPFMVVNMDQGLAANTLPYIPILPAAQEIRARIEYVDLGQFSGIWYISSFGQDASPILGNELQFTFQGISADGSTYVSLVAPLNTTLIPEELPADFDYDAFVATIGDAFNETTMIINSGAATDFTPSLDVLVNIVRSFSLTPDLVVQTTNPTPIPQPTAVVNTDPTLGGLVGTWTLVSYGPADAQTAALTEPPVTLAFSEQGVGGSAGCNTFGGSFTYDNSTLTFSPLVSTLIACADPAIGQQETAFLTALQGATSYSIADGTLTIFYPDGSLIFTSTVPGAEATPTAAS